MTVKFTTTPEERRLTEAIADRLEKEINITYADKVITERAEDFAATAYDREDLLMDLRATNANGCPLDFQRLLDAPGLDFLHDVYGIRRYLDRKTGQLTDCFHPRCSKPENSE